jgi:DNA-binding response OmpR family regulator
MTTVLIADDSIAVRKVAERLLTEAGFGVTLAANGEEALAYLAKETPDVVVSDVIMPDRSGYEVCTFVRAQRALANTPVLLISGIVNDEVTKQAESCHADGVLKKPFQGTSLKDRVIELLAKRQRIAMPVAKTVEKVVEPIEPIHGFSVSGDELEARRQAVAQAKSLEEELRIERGRVAYSAQRVVQLEEQLDSVKELESMLAREREQTAQLKKQVTELESLLEIERAQTVEAKMQASVAESLGGRVRELEAALQTERQAATQLVEQMTEMEETATRYQQVSQQLLQEQECTRDLTHRVAASEQLAVRAGSLEEALADERKKTNALATRISETEPASQKAHEFEALLQMERERNNLLAKRMTETEQEAELATKRFEEMARKLGEIAGLASQLGSGKRRP